MDSHGSKNNQAFDEIQNSANSVTHKQSIETFKDGLAELILVK